MDLSGIIFVVLALAWAVYLVPKALKHHDEVARTRSIDRFSTAMRVLARREPVDRRNARLVVTPARSGGRILLPSRAGEADAAPVASADPRDVATVRAAARAAARRRRHVTLSLLAVDLLVVGFAVFAVVPWWSFTIPVVLTALYLAMCRRSVRRENDALWDAPVMPVERSLGAASVVPRRAIRVEAPYGTVQAPREVAHAETTSADDEDTVAIEMPELETVAVSVETADGGSLWDPLPITLPTYVHKARAPRTVHTIDLGAPDAWTSGRDEADSALVEQTVAAQSVAEPADETREADHPRAVGS